MPQELKKIIVSRTDHIGDVVLSLPVFASLKKCFPAAEIIALVSDYTADVARSSTNIDEVVTWNNNDSVLSAYKKFKRVAPDVIVVLFPRFKISAASFLAKIPIRIGTAYRWYSFLFNRKVREHRKYSVKSEAEYNLTLIEALGCKSKVMDAALSVNETASRSVEAFINQNCLTKFVVVHPGSGGSAFEWGADNFRRVVKTITDTISENVVVTGTASERSMCKKISEGIGNAINAAGRFSILELIALASKADLFISNSTGPLHLAAAVGTPIIGIYPNKKPMVPARWAPLTDKKVILTPTDGSDDLSLITVEQVIQPVRKFIQ